MIIKKKLTLYFVVVFLFSKTIFPSSEKNLETAVLAGGCFWCMESDFEKLPGIKSVVSGYTGGYTKNPNYNNYEKAGHIEAVKILFDPSQINFSNLLEIFWMNIDPLDGNGQFCDRGHGYTSAIFYLSIKQKSLAEKSKMKLVKSGIFNEPLQTSILEANDFFYAEDYHQDYYKKNPLKYKYYRFRCGRDNKLKKLWGENYKRYKSFKNKSQYKSSEKKKLEKILTPLEFDVTQNSGTEPPFRNKYWNNNREGIYVDIVSGEPLFSSIDKYKSGTGWPSFTKPITGTKLIRKKDKSWLGIVRTELRSQYTDSHLGHLFDDGPKPIGLRYCINSAALRFISKKNLIREGYYIYSHLFQN